MKEEIKTCQNCRNEFSIEPDDFGFYEKIKVPPPTWCPECRSIRRMIWRNERSLYHNTCAFSGKPIISMFSPETKLTVYDRDIWWSDRWSPLDYGKEYDFSKPFFEQFRELMQQVPLASVGNTNCVKSEFGNHNVDLKNCYLVYASFSNENVSYSQGAVNVRDSFDLYTVMKSEQCYDDTLCSGLYKTNFSFESDDSINSAFITSCINLQDCLGCANLRHKSYCIFNKQHSKEDYDKKRLIYDFGSYKTLSAFKKEYADFLLKQPRRLASILKSVNVTGDNVLNSKNSRMIFDIYGDVENSKYLAHGGLVIRESYDGYGTGAKAEFCYESVDTGLDGSRQLFSVLNHGCLETHYTYMCYGAKFLFGCIGLQKQDYCILNKKYSKEEYKSVKEKIIKQMKEMPFVDKRGFEYYFGEFFPEMFSDFAYNETVANYYFPLSREVALSRGYAWKDTEKKDYITTIKSKDLPESIAEIDDSILNEVVECEEKDNTESL